MSRDILKLKWEIQNFYDEVLYCKMKASPYFFDCSSTCLKYKVRIEQKEEKEKKRIDKEKKI